MARVLDDDLRLRLLKASAAGLSAPAAARFEVAICTAIRWITRAKDGEPTSRPQGWRRPSALGAHEAFVIELIEERKDVTLDEMVLLLSVERQIRISETKALESSKISRKPSVTTNKVGKSAADIYPLFGREPLNASYLEPS